MLLLQSTTRVCLREREREMLTPVLCSFLFQPCLVVFSNRETQFKYSGFNLVGPGRITPSGLWVQLARFKR